MSEVIEKSISAVLTLLWLALGAILMVLLMPYRADAKTRIKEDTPSNKIFVSDGKVVNVLQAGEDAKAGKTVLICQRGEYVCSEKSGKCGVEKVK